MRAMVVLLIPMLVLSCDIAEAQKATDVLGISVGMTLDEAKKALEASGSGWIYSKNIFEEPQDQLRLIFALKKDASGNVIERITIGSRVGDTKVYLVGRETQFPLDGLLSISSVQEATEEKYGPPAFKRGAFGFSSYWATDHAGTLLTTGRAAAHCFLGESWRFGIFDEGTVRGVEEVSKPRTFHPSCGITIKADVSTTQDMRLARGLTVTIIDNQLIVPWQDPKKQQNDAPKETQAPPGTKLKL